MTRVVALASRSSSNSSPLSLSHTSTIISSLLDLTPKNMSSPPAGQTGFPLLRTDDETRVVLSSVILTYGSERYAAAP